MFIVVAVLLGGMVGCSSNESSDGKGNGKEGATAGTCLDGLDNDGDKLVDCADPECANRAICSGAGDSDSGMDSSPENSTDSDAGTDSNLAGCSFEKTCANNTVCCGADEECVERLLCLPICPAEQERCGENKSVCCAAGQVCLDDIVCAANCPENQSVCGSNFEVCCAQGQLCLNGECVLPGNSCADDFDCFDAGSYCEPSVNQCMPIPKGIDCETTLAFNEIDITPEWHWPGVMHNGVFYQDVMTTPAVGDITGDGIPDVVVPVYNGDISNWADTQVILVALNGRPADADPENGEVLWIVDDPKPIDEMVALAQIDDDPAMEIVYHAPNRGLIVLDGDVSPPVVKFERSDVDPARFTPAVADLNQDGAPDLIAGCNALNGSQLDNPDADLFRFGSCQIHSASLSVVSVADLDGDGFLDVTNGEQAHGIDSSGLPKTLWNRGSQSYAGFTAVADLNVDTLPEVIVIRNGLIEVLEGASGAVLIGVGGTWVNGEFLLEGGGVGGAPTVSDFDNDGFPEVSAAGRGFYSVYDPDCLPTPPRVGGTCNTLRTGTDFVLWTTATRDVSSSATGSSVFDFQGDGISEVVYNDECFLHIFDGATGSELLAGGPRPNSSRTRHEYPLVVDVDYDGNSEIVVAANRDQVNRDKCFEFWQAHYNVSSIDALPEWLQAGTGGIWVLGDTKDEWVGTRPVWSDYGYHITNIQSSGAVPAIEKRNWTETGLNNYRTNVQGGRVRNAPNLTVDLNASAQCGNNYIQLQAAVTNIGARGVPAGVLVEFYQTAPGDRKIIYSIVTDQSILPGGVLRLSTEITDIEVKAQYAFEVRVDGESAQMKVNECNEDDNAAEANAGCDMVIIVE